MLRMTGRFQRDKPAVAVTEHSGGSSRCLNGEEILGLACDFVIRSLGIAYCRARVAP